MVQPLGRRHHGPDSPLIVLALFTVSGLSQAAAMTVHIEASKKKCMVSNSLRRGFPVEITQV